MDCVLRDRRSLSAFLSMRRQRRLRRHQGGGAHALRRSAPGGEPYNIRTTIISPGAVESDLPQSLTEPDMAKNVAAFYEAYAIPADSFARVAAFAISQPADVDINGILVRPTAQEL